MKKLTTLKEVVLIDLLVFFHFLFSLFWGGVCYSALWTLNKFKCAQCMKKQLNKMLNNANPKIEDAQIEGSMSYGF